MTNLGSKYDPKAQKNENYRLMNGVDSRIHGVLKPSAKKTVFVLVESDQLA